MAAKKTSPAFTFAKNQLQKNPAVSFADVQDRAQKKGIDVMPIVYGRAKLALGLVAPKKKVAKRGPGRPPKRGPGRPRKVAVSASPVSALEGLEGIVDAMRHNDAERERLRHALLAIQQIVDDALSGQATTPRR